MAGLRTALPALGRFVARFGPLVRRERPLVWGSCVALVLEIVFRLAEPWPLKWALDEVTHRERSRAPGALPGVLDRLDGDVLLAVLGLLVVVCAVLRAIAAYLGTIGLSLAGSRVLTEVRAALYAHVQRLPLAFHHRARTGDLITRLTSDINKLQEVAVTAALPLAVNVLTLLGMVGVMAWVNLQLALTSLAVIPLFFVAVVRQTGSIRAAARQQRKREGAMAGVAAESMGAIKVVQALGLERVLERRFSKSNAASLRDGVKAKRLSAGLERRVDVLAAAATALAVWQGARLVRAGAITPGDLVLFFLYLKTAFKPVRDMAKYTGRLASAAASGERVLELLDLEPEIRDRPGAVVAPPLRGAVAYRGVHLAYEPGHPVLHGVDLEVQPGQSVALVGPSGGGKSSLLALLLRLYEPDAGRVEVDGHDLRDLTLASLRGQIGTVLQESVLFAVSVRENIAWGAPEASDDEVEAAARLAGAHDFIGRLPRGYETVLGERGATLSGGQRQRIAIARAALRRAPIVVLDEPTVGLDRESERVVLAALRRLGRGRTSFWVAHDLPTVRDADLIAFVDRGRILERGTHDELMARDGAYAAMYRVQAGEAEPRLEPPPEPVGSRRVGAYALAVRLAAAVASGSSAVRAGPGGSR